MTVAINHDDIDEDVTDPFGDDFTPVKPLLQPVAPPVSDPYIRGLLTKEQLGVELSTDDRERLYAYKVEHGLIEARKAPERRHTWAPVDLTDVLDGKYEPPQPTVGARKDGVGLFYPGRMHTVASESEGGKTWFALAACKHELEKGNAVLYMDFEDDEGGVVGRLRTLGVEREVIRERFAYVRPESGLNDPTSGHLDWNDLKQIIEELQPTLAVIDGVTEAMSLHGMEMKDNTDIANFGKLLPRRVADLGPAVVALDHVTKDRETRGRYAIGGVHKLNGLNGAAFVLENRIPFGIGLTGKSTISLTKDRPGQLRKHALPSSGGLHWFADLELESQSETIARVDIEAPQRRDEDFRPTVLMERVAAELAKHPDGLSARKIEALVPGNSKAKRDALVFLQVDGFVSDSTPHKLLKAYQPASDDPLEQ